MGGMTPELSIVIPCFNGWDLTAACLASIARHTPEAHEVILVDNGSTDGTADHFARTWDGDGALLRNRRNAGFGVACNQGLAVAAGRVGMVLNNDTLVTPGWSTGLLDALRRDPAVGVAVPRSNHVGGAQSCCRTSATAALPTPASTRSPPTAPRAWPEPGAPPPG